MLRNIPLSLFGCHQEFLLDNMRGRRVLGVEAACGKRAIN